MKPRKRTEQKQTSRMYLRKKDHRDAIINDTYHNAIWTKKTQNGVEKDELFWLKHPDRKLVFVADFNDFSGMFSLDIDRQFIHHQVDNLTQNRATMLNRTRNFCVNIKQRAIAVSKDGFVYKTSENIASSDVSWLSWTRVGDTDCFIGKTEQSPYKTLSLYKIEIMNYDKDTYEYETRYTQLPDVHLGTETNDTQGYLIGTSQNGVVYIKRVTLGSGTSAIGYYRLYNIDVTGACTVLADLTDFPDVLGNDDYGVSISTSYGQNIIVECNGHYYMSLCFRVKKKNASGETVYEQHARIIYSTDLRNWNGVDLGETHYESTYAHTPDAVIVARNGKVYCYAIYQVSANGNRYAKLYVSEDMETFHEAIMPSVVDIPIVKDGGRCISPTTQYEYVRVITNESLKPSTKPDNVIELFPFNTVHFNATIYENCYKFFKQGELKNNYEAECGIFVNDYNCAVYTPTMDFREHEDMFAFVTSSSGERAEKVMEGDYVLRKENI